MNILLESELILSDLGNPLVSLFLRGNELGEERGEGGDVHEVWVDGAELDAVGGKGQDNFSLDRAVVEVGSGDRVAGGWCTVWAGALFAVPDSYVVVSVEVEVDGEEGIRATGWLGLVVRWLYDGEFEAV